MKAMNSASHASRQLKAVLQSWRIWLVPSAVSASALYFLVFLVPYAAGYLGPRLPLAQTLKNMWAYEQWQHCWLVLPAVIAIVSMQRKELARLPLRGSAWGIVPLAAALLAFWAGYRVENYYIGFFSIHLLVGGLILWFLGWRWFFALIFPFMFLVFLWPLYFLENSITFPLRMIMSHAGVTVLNLLGTPVVLQGTGLISAPDVLLGIPAGKKFSVDVADPCSGIRSLFALMMVSALYAHFTLETWWKKWILFLCSIPLAIVGNLVRILTLTLGTVAFGAEFAIGKNPLTNPSWFHMGAGYMVFAVALGGMIGVAWLLDGGAAGLAGQIHKFLKQTDERPHSPAPGKPASTPASPRPKRQDLY
jgi:exosortase